MWSRNIPTTPGPFVRLAAVLAIAGLAAGCFQPLYGERSPTRTGAVGANIRDALAAVEVERIDAASGTPEARIAVELRNNIIFELTGGGGAATPAYRLKVRMAPSRSAIIVDIATGRTEAEIVGIDAFYTLTEIGTRKTVVTAQTFARVSSDIPGLQQRFARQRAQRDAEDRAAKVIAEHIRSRIASHFVAGT